MIRRMAVILSIVTVQVVVSCYIYRLRTKSDNWDDLPHSDLFVFVLPVPISAALTALLLRRDGWEWTPSVFLGIVGAALALGVFAFIAFNTWGT